MTLEDRVSHLESSTDHILSILEQHTQELAAIRRIQNDQFEAIQAIAGTLTEQSRILIGHSSILAEHSGILTEHSRILTEHSQILSEHSEAVQSISGILNEHTRILLEHSVDLQFIKEALGGSSDQGSA